MASLLPFPANGIRPYASSDHRRSNPHRSSKPSSASASASANPNWWAPIFGWSSEPDYIDGDDRSRAQISDPDSGRAGSRFAPGCFTEEKAKELRKKTMESANFHDVMYHSAIASRLASDLPDKPSRR
ncbi:hypothetical protein AAC387_Pa02g0673 [Persea americana]